MNRTRTGPARRHLRRLSGVTAALVATVGTSVALAGPAAADVPEGWETADPINPLHLLAVIAGVPLLLGLVIAACVYLPALARGERVAPGAPDLEDQWIGGPRKAAGELAAPDTEASAAGGAGGRW